MGIKGLGIGLWQRRAVVVQGIGWCIKYSTCWIDRDMDYSSYW